MHKVTLDDGTVAISTGRLLYVPDDGTPERFPGYYRDRRGGVAWRIFGAEVEQVEVEDTEAEADGFPARLLVEVRETGRVIAVMVGDDERHAFDPADLEPIGDDDFCAVCGQMGCTHDGREREGVAS